MKNVMMILVCVFLMVSLISCNKTSVDYVNDIKIELEDCGISDDTQDKIISEFTILVINGESCNRAFALSTERAGLGLISLPSTSLEKEFLSLYNSIIDTRSEYAYLQTIVIPQTSAIVKTFVPDEEIVESMNNYKNNN